MPLIVDDQISRDLLKQSNINVNYVNELNRVHSNMPEAERKDLESRWRTYWYAKRQLPQSEKMLATGRWRTVASEQMVPWDYAYQHLLGYIAEKKQAIADFEKYVRDVTKVYA